MIDLLKFECDDLHNTRAPCGIKYEQKIIAIDIASVFETLGNERMYKSQDILNSQ